MTPRNGSNGTTSNCYAVSIVAGLISPVTASHGQAAKSDAIGRVKSVLVKTGHVKIDPEKMGPAMRFREKSGRVMETGVPIAPTARPATATVRRRDDRGSRDARAVIGRRATVQTRRVLSENPRAGLHNQTNSANPKELNPHW
jgi:hypothetical protein